MSIPIPPNPDGQVPDFTRILGGVVEVDQFDDWLPDPVFFQDQRSSAPAAVQRLSATWQRRQIDTDGALAIEVPRKGGGRLQVLTLPFDLRCVAHAVISDFAARSQDKLIRDKVRGFTFSAGGTGALFAPPGSELSDLGALVLNAIAVTGGSGIQVVDVADFSGSARATTLAATLTGVGVDNAQALFLQRIITLGGSGLASIDDAFGFVYNFYLRPVDEALAKKRINFFRYRDEYLVLSDADVPAVREALAAQELRGETAGVTLNQGDLESNLPQRWQETGDHPEDDRVAEEQLGRIRDGVILARCSVDSNGDSCMSDSFEIDFEMDRGQALDRMFGAAATGAILDAVEILPILRSFNQLRVPAVAFLAPFTATTAEHRTLSTMLAKQRRTLEQAFRAGLDGMKAPWQVAWCAGLISEGGVLEPETQTLMQSALGIGLVPEIEWQARLCLARSSTLGAGAIWTPAQSPLARRAAALAAYYLAKRGDNVPWNTLQAEAADDRSPVQWLQANL